MSDVVLNLQIEGEASGAVSAAQETVDALGGLTSASAEVGSNASAAAKGGEEASSAFAGMGQAASNALGGIKGISPEFGMVASSGKEVAGAFGEIAEAGDSLGGIASGVTAGFAVLAGVFFELGHAGAELSHELAGQMSLTGMHAEDLDVWDKALQNVGGSTQGITSGSRIFTAQLYQLQDAQLAGNPLTRKQKDELDMLGGSLYNGVGQMKSFAEAFPEVMSNLAGMEDHTKRNQIVTDLFGRSSADMKLLLDNYTPSLLKAQEQSEKLGLTDEKVTQTNVKYNQAMTDLRTTFEAVALQTTPALISVLETTGGALDFVSDHWGNVKDAVGYATGAVRAYIEPARFAIATTLNFASGLDFGPVISGVQSVASAIGSLGSISLPDFSGIFGGLASAAASVAGVVGSVFGSLGGIVSGAMGSIGGAINAGASVFSILSGAASTVAGIVSSIFGAIGSAIGDAMSVIGSVIGAGAAVFNTLASAATSVVSTVVGAFNSMADGVTSAVGSIIDAINSIADAISSIPVVGGVFNSITGRASGGPVSAGQAYIVGEHSPELFVPNTSGTIIPGAAPGRADGFALGAGGSGVTNVFNLVIQGSVNGVTDLDRRFQQFAREMAQYQTGLRGYLQTAS